MSADFFTGEYGDTLTVTMPLDVTGAAITIAVHVPGVGDAIWTGGVTITPVSISRTVLQGELDAPGEYRCAVVATTTIPPRVRKVRFSFTVVDPAA